MYRSILFVFTVLASISAAAQLFDAGAMAKWSTVAIVHYEVTGEILQPRVQIPPGDADLYGDVAERVSVSFDWDRNEKRLVGTPVFTNHAATVTNLMGMAPECPTGKLNGPFEYFDIVSVKQTDGSEIIELIGERIRPETLVAESCGASLRRYAGATETVMGNLVPLDPEMFAYAAMMTDGPVRISKDGKSLIMTALNDNWVWTYTPTAK